jgi:hypothetical protein
MVRHGIQERQIAFGNCRKRYAKCMKTIDSKGRGTCVADNNVIILKLVCSLQDNQIFENFQKILLSIFEYSPIFQIKS